VKVAVQDIKESPTIATFSEDAGDVNALLRHGAHDYHARAIGVSLVYYRAGMDVFVDGEFWANLDGTCSRCLIEYPFPLARRFNLLLAPISELGPLGERSGELREEDLSLSYYTGEEIDFSPLVQEQLILALPTRPLCSASCRGLCPQCGASLNAGECGCVVEHDEPRLAMLRSLKVSH
jgi:uncharacterized protein